jgi:thiol-disulfide isomerase/thioredoxin
MRPLPLLAGVAAAAVAIALLIVLHTGASLFDAALVIAAAFCAAGAALPRAPAAVALGGTAPVAALAATGIAFASLAWAGTFVAVAFAFAFAGAAARQGAGPPAPPSRPRWLAVPLVAWAALLLAGRPLLGALASATATDHVTRDIAPFTLTAADGRSLTSGELRGRVVVLAFWATWCEPCRAELPELAAVADRYRADRRVALQWVNAGSDGDTLAVARQFAADHHVALPLAFDATGRLAATLGATGLPALAVLDRSGRLRLLHRGFDRSEALAAMLTAEIDRLLAN